jgi:hypothetical protein
MNLKDTFLGVKNVEGTLLIETENRPDLPAAASFFRDYL